MEAIKERESKKILRGENVEDCSGEIPSPVIEDLDMENISRVPQVHIENSLNENDQTYVQIDNNERKAQSDDCKKKESINLYDLEVTYTIKPFSEDQLLTMYQNNLLEDKTSIVNNFLDLQQPTCSTDFYKIILDYSIGRSSLYEIEVELDQLHIKQEDIEKEIWTFENKICDSKGVCNDKTTVKDSLLYEESFYHENFSEQFAKLSKEIRHNLFEVHVLHSYHCELLRLKAENYLHDTLACCEEFKIIDKYAPISCCSSNCEKPYFYHLMKLRDCISVLFIFTRRYNNDKKFITDMKSMLYDAVALYLRFASYNDHYFIINNLLRCPAGVGEWGAQLLQVKPPSVAHDQSSIGSVLLDHCVTILDFVLSTVEDRDKFLKKYNKKGTDLNVEQCEKIHENDIIQFLNQIPFEEMFKHMLLIRHIPSFSTSQLSPNMLIKAFAFSTCLLKILCKGFSSYEGPQYSSMHKKLCFYIQHIVLYITDVIRYYKETPENYLNDIMLERLWVEYDQFLERVIEFSYCMPYVNQWELLSDIPYEYISSSKAWKIAYIFHMKETKHEKINFKLEFKNDSTFGTFCSIVEEMDEFSAILYLTAISNLALKRAQSDQELIEAITKNLFKLSFKSEFALKNLCPTLREILSNIINKHSFVPSLLLKTIVEYVEEIRELTLYFIEAFDLSKWNVSEKDFQYLNNWLMLDNRKIEHNISRAILERLNWGFENDKLFLPKEFHIKVAMNVLNSYQKLFMPESNILAVSVNQVASVFTGSSSGQWYWTMIGKLHLHRMDQSDSEVRVLLMNPGELEDIYDCNFAQIVETFKNELSSNNPFCMYLSFLISHWGHNSQKFLQNGADVLESLVYNKHYESSVTMLSLISPLFFHRSEELISNGNIIKAVQSILSAQDTYMNRALKFVTNIEKESVKLFTSMITAQIYNYQRYNLESSCLIVSFWIDILCSVPKWQSDLSVLEIIDVICKLSVMDKYCWQVLKQKFIDKTIVNVSEFQKKGTLSSLYGIVTLSNDAGSLLSSYSNPKFAWFALTILHCEAQLQTDVWRLLLLKIKNNSSSSLQSCLKDSCTELGIESIHSNSLCLYRLGQQLIDLPTNHDCYAVTLQAFLTLYLARPAVSSQRFDTASVIQTFFEGYVNSNFLAKIKNKISEFGKLRRESFSANEKDEGLMVIIAMTLYWICDEKFYESGLDLSSLPHHYMPNKLRLLLEYNWTLWYELIDNKLFKDTKTRLLNSWGYHRSQKTLSHSDSVQSLKSLESPIESIVNRLRSYKKPQDAPPVNKKLSSQIKPLFRPDNLIFDIDLCLERFMSQANSTMMISKEMSSLDVIYIENQPDLWHNKDATTTSFVECNPSTAFKSKKCSGPAEVNFHYKKAKLNKSLKIKLECNRQQKTSLENTVLSTHVLTLSKAAIQIEELIGHLILWHNETLRQNSPDLCTIEKLGLKLFYHLIEKINEETNFYLPSKELISESIDLLAQNFVSENSECQMELIKCILDSDNICRSFMSTHFSPQASSIEIFIKLYELVSKQAGIQPDIVFVLLSKFEIESALKNELIVANGRKCLFDIILKTLSSFLSNTHESASLCTQLYRIHLMALLKYHFYELCDDFLSTLLQHSFDGIDEGEVLKHLWPDFVNLLSRDIAIYNEDMEPNEFFKFLVKFAEEQSLLNHKMILSLLNTLTLHFEDRRMLLCRGGLHTKYSKYIKPISAILGMVSCSYIQMSMYYVQGAMSMPDISDIWRVIERLYAPWLCPIGGEAQCPVWIQDLNPPKKILMPWLKSNTEGPSYVANVFLHVLSYMCNTSNGANVDNALTLFLGYYENHFAKKHVESHVLTIVNSTFTLAPWNSFTPSINCMEVMHQILQDFLPECHEFIAKVFVQIKWLEVGKHYCTPESLYIHFQDLFLNILIIIALEPVARQNSDLKAIMMDAQELSWHLVDFKSFDRIINWVVSSFDSRIVLNSESRNVVDIALLELLYLMAGFRNIDQKYHPESHYKKCLLLRAIARLLLVCSKKHGILLASQPFIFEQTYGILFNEIESSFCQDDAKKKTKLDESVALVNEIIEVISGNSPLLLQEACSNSLAHWLQGSHSQSIVPHAVLISVSQKVIQPNFRCPLMEESIKAVFKCNKNILWTDLISELNFPANPETMLSYSAQCKHLMIIYAYALWAYNIKKTNKEDILNDIAQSFQMIKPDETCEVGYLLIVDEMLKLIGLVIDTSGSFKQNVWEKAQLVTHILQSYGESSFLSGILNMLSLRSKPSLSPKARLICEALHQFLSSQLIKPGVFKSLNEQPEDTVLSQVPITSFEALKKTNVNFKEAVDFAVTFIKKECHSMLDINILLAGLIKSLFSDVTELRHLTFKLMHS